MPPDVSVTSALAESVPRKPLNLCAIATYSQFVHHSISLSGCLSAGFDAGRCRLEPQSIRTLANPSNLANHWMWSMWSRCLSANSPVMALSTRSLRCCRPYATFTPSPWPVFAQAV